MKLYDIRTALKNLVHINKDLTKDRLTTLLQAAGWEEQDIKDAVLLWETNSFSDADTSSQTADITLKEDMTPVEEVLDNATTIFAETSVSNDVLSAQIPKDAGSVENKEEKSSEDANATEQVDIEQAVDIPKSEPTAPVKVEEPVVPEQSGVPVTPPSVFDYVSKQTPHTELPHNLPLRPYESSYVTVPLNEYEKRFVSSTKSPVDTMQTFNPQTVAAPVVTIDEKPRSATEAVLIPQYPKDQPLHIDRVVEAPLETEDKYLAFIAIVLFVLIMFILGYMHIIGRI